MSADYFGIWYTCTGHEDLMTSTKTPRNQFSSLIMGSTVHCSFCFCTANLVCHYIFFKWLPCVKVRNSHYLNMQILYICSTCTYTCAYNTWHLLFPHLGGRRLENHIFWYCCSPFLITRASPFTTSTTLPEKLREPCGTVEEESW